MPKTEESRPLAEPTPTAPKEEDQMRRKRRIVASEEAQLDDPINR
jgi:hypothetical protein